MVTNIKFKVGDIVSDGFDTGEIKKIDIREHGDNDYFVKWKTDNSYCWMEENFLEEMEEVDYDTKSRRSA